MNADTESTRMFHLLSAHICVHLWQFYLSSLRLSVSAEKKSASIVSGRGENIIDAAQGKVSMRILKMVQTSNVQLSTSNIERQRSRYILVNLMWGGKWRFVIGLNACLFESGWVGHLHHI
jgi:hypothetical protein